MIDYSQNCLVTSILAADERTPPMRITTWEKEQLITWNWNLNSSSSVFTRDGHAQKFAHICTLSASFRISRIRMAIPSFHPCSNHIGSVLDFLTSTDQDGWVRYEQSPGLNVLESHIAKALPSHFHHLEQPFWNMVRQDCLELFAIDKLQAKVSGIR